MANSTSKLAGVTADVFQGIKTLAKASDDLSRRGPAAVNGVFGGVLCATVGYVASICYQPLNTPVFLVLITMTGLSGGVALTRLLAETSDKDSLQQNNAVFAELIERSQNPAFSPEQRKLLLEQAIAISLELGQTTSTVSPPSALRPASDP